jgi:protein-S-isoprenylcysteine O-methyltransferase Ste14
MNVSAIAFRFRVPVFLLLYLLGFFAPWDFRGGNRGTLWLAASTMLARTGWTGSTGLSSATMLVTMTALVCLAAGAVLRVWGTGYLGPGIMSGLSMQGNVLVAAGPYRLVRNPLYLGSWLLALGVSILMPPAGAALFLPAYCIFTLYLISAEERFLAAQQGDSYQQYLRRVPRLLPYRKPTGPASPVRPQWGPALLAETYAVGITLCFAVFAWRYNARILIRCVLICYGISLVMRALARPPASGSRPNWF